jgi:outer membrane lipoprotein carrier protein
MAPVHGKSYSHSMYAFVLSFLLAFSNVSLAEDASALIQRVEARYAEIEVIDAKFQQRTASSIYGEDIQQGSVTLKRPMKMRWDFGDKQFIMDGKTLWVYSIPDKQVLRYDTSGGPVDPMYSLLGSLDKLGALFDAALVQSDSNGHVLDLTPKGEAEFKKVRLELSEALLLKKVSVTNPMGDPVELVFSEVKMGGDASDAQFTFKAPEGVEVVDIGGLTP